MSVATISLTLTSYIFFCSRFSELAKFCLRALEKHVPRFVRGSYRRGSSACSASVHGILPHVVLCVVQAQAPGRGSFPCYGGRFGSWSAAVHTMAFIAANRQGRRSCTAASCALGTSASSPFNWPIVMPARGARRSLAGF